MRRIKLIVAYKGTNYCGWQIQNDKVTIESCLNEALSNLCKENIKVIGASRTDAGVHALGNIAVFDTDSRIPAEKFAFALNTMLPEDIVVQKSEEADEQYHPRHCDTIKTYEYKILNRRMPLPLLATDTIFCHYPLDIENMQKAANYLVGEHDFKSFCSVNTQALTTVRTIFNIDVEEKNLTLSQNGTYSLDAEEFSLEEGRIVTIRISGNGFLYNMVRIIAGTLLEIGNGFYPPEKINEILKAKDRQKAGPTAPAKGLTLVNIMQKNA